MNGKMLDRVDHNSILAVKNLKLAAFMFKMMEHYSKAYDIQCVDSTTVLQYQQQWEKNNWVKTMENIVLHL